MKTDKDISIVIICMNNIKNLFPCLDSIFLYTKVDYEIFVVAYLFSKENLTILRENYPKVIIVESNETRGYSENNNLAIRQVRTPYCMILNDDTYFESPLIDGLLKTMEDKNDEKLALISPVLYFPDGRVQYNGREKRTGIDYVFTRLKLEFLWKRSKHSNKSGIYQSYNVTGACFIIKTDVFKELGYFDEQYYFCPEDIALSTLANEKGYKVYVDTNYKITHIHQASSNKLMPALLPVTDLGACLFYGRNSLLVNYLLRFMVFLQALLKYTFVFLFFAKDRSVHLQTYKNIASTIFTKRTTKAVFIDLLAKLDS